MRTIKATITSTIVKTEYKTADGRFEATFTFVGKYSEDRALAKIKKETGAKQVMINEYSVTRQRYGADVNDFLAIATPIADDSDADTDEN